jgi:hypothetical protein
MQTISPAAQQLFEKASSPAWQQNFLAELRCQISFAVAPVPFVAGSASGLPPGIETERSKAELLRLAGQYASAFGEREAKRIVFAAAVAGALSSLFEDILKTCREAEAAGRHLRQSAEHQSVLFAAELESVLALLSELIRAKARGLTGSDVEPGSETESRAAACFKCSLLLIREAAALVSGLEMDDEASVSGEQAFAHLSNIARMAHIARELFQGRESALATEEIMAYLGVV